MYAGTAVVENVMGGEVSDLNERVRKLTFKDMGGFWWQLPMKVSPHCSAKFPSLLM